MSARPERLHLLDEWFLWLVDRVGLQGASLLWSTASLVGILIVIWLGFKLVRAIAYRGGPRTDNPALKVDTVLDLLEERHGATAVKDGYWLWLETGRQLHHREHVARGVSIDPRCPECPMSAEERAEVRRAL